MEQQMCKRFVYERADKQCVRCTDIVRYCRVFTLLQSCVVGWLEWVHEVKKFHDAADQAVSVNCVIGACNWQLHAGRRCGYNVLQNAFCFFSNTHPPVGVYLDPPPPVGRRNTSLGNPSGAAITAGSSLCCQGAWAQWWSSCGTRDPETRTCMCIPTHLNKPCAGQGHIHHHPLAVFHCLAGWCSTAWCWCISALLALGLHLYVRIVVYSTQPVPTHTHTKKKMKAFTIMHQQLYHTGTALAWASRAAKIRSRDPAGPPCDDVGGSSGPLVCKTAEDGAATTDEEEEAGAREGPAWPTRRATASLYL